MRLKEHEKNYRLRFDNGIAVEILRNEGVFGGLGYVKWGRRKLRSTELPILPLISTPNGYVVSRLEFEDIEEEDDGVCISLRPSVVPAGRMEWLCYDGQDRWNVGTWAEHPVRDRGGMLQLTLRAVNRSIGGTSFVGFSYAYKFHSRKYHVYRIHDRATWELGGWATGNSFWMRGPSNPPRKTFKNKDDSFTTAWCTSGEEAVQLQQFLPLFTGLQGFSFQFDRNSILLTAFEEVFHCNSLFQKESGRNYLVHWHQLCTDLQSCVEFPALQILCAEADGDEETEMAQTYCAVRDELQGQYRDQTGITRSHVVPSGCLLGSSNNVKGMQRGLDELSRAGCARAYIPGAVRALAPEKGTVTARRQAAGRVEEVIAHAHARALEIGLSLSDCCAAWLLADTADEGTEPAGKDGEFITAALRDEEQWELLMRHLRRVKNEFGVDCLFAESLLGTLSARLEWVGQPGKGRIARSSGTIRSLAERRIELVNRLQELGYRCLLRGVGELDALDSAPVHEGLDGCQFMFRDAVLRFPHDRTGRSEDDLLMIFFEGCANRLSYMPVYDASRGMRGSLDEWWEEDYAAVNRAYQAVREYMEDSVLLPDHRGILWSGAEPEVSVLWSYEEFRHRAGEGAEVFDVIDSECVELEEGEFTAEPCRVYLIQTGSGS